MSYDFKICTQIDSNYKINYNIEENLFLNFNTYEYLVKCSKDQESILCFGYCFDVRNPERTVEETLSTLLNEGNIEENINFLNGHYIIIHSKNKISLYTDASSLTPVYFSNELKEVCNNLVETQSFVELNPNFRLDLHTFTVTRFNSLKNYKDVQIEEIYEQFIYLLKNQFKFFSDKSLSILFQANSYHKALFAILSPTLSYKNILVRKIDEKGFNAKFGKQFSNEFNMNYYEVQEGEDEYPLVEDLNFLARNNLSNYKAIYQKRNNAISDETLVSTYGINEENKDLFNYEFNLVNNYLKSNHTFSNNFLLYEPLNVRELLSLLVELKNREGFNTNLYVIDELRPSLNFYNFTNGQNLREINLELKQENTELKSNSMSSQNQKFLINAKLSNFKLSQNLDGKLKKEEILIYPAKQKVKKGTKYTVQYKNDEEGLVLIESFYKNEKNAKRIIVTINGEKFNIFDFYGGRYFYSDGNINIIMSYTQDYDSLSWQKAGTIRIKKVK